MRFVLETSYPLKKLSRLLLKADSGTWGDEGIPGTDSPVLRSSNIQNYRLDLSDLAYRKFSEKERKRCELSENDILVTKSSGSPDLIGKCCLFKNLENNSAHYFSNFTQRLRADQNLLDPRWLFYYLSSSFGRAALHAMNDTTSGLRNLNIQRYLDQYIPVPPMNDQKRIAAILDKADAIRRKREKALQLADEFLRSVFLDMFGDPVTNPKGWDECSLDEISEIVSGVTKGRKLNGKTVFVPYMRVANVQDGHIIIDDIQKIEVMATEVEKFRLKEGDILLTEGGDPDKLGRGAVWQGEVDPCIHQNHIFRVRPNETKVIPEYLSALIGSSRGKTYFLRAAKQTTGIASINKTQLRGFPALVPPRELQVEYLTIRKKLHVTISKIQFEAKLSDRLFNSISHRAFRGEL